PGAKAGHARVRGQTAGDDSWTLHGEAEGASAFQRSAKSIAGTGRSQKKEARDPRAFALLEDTGRSQRRRPAGHRSRARKKGGPVALPGSRLGSQPPDDALPAAPAV